MINKAQVNLCTTGCTHGNSHTYYIIVIKLWLCRLQHHTLCYKFNLYRPYIDILRYFNWILIRNLRPCSHCQFYPTRVPLTVRVELPVYTLRRIRPVHSDHIGRCSQGNANGTRLIGAAVWTREWTHRVRQRCAVRTCLHTDLFLSTPLICNAANRARRNHDTVG